LYGGELSGKSGGRVCAGGRKTSHGVNLKSRQQILPTKERLTESEKAHVNLIREAIILNAGKSAGT
jgi:hypothetical protein